MPLTAGFRAITLLDKLLKFLPHLLRLPSHPLQARQLSVNLVAHPDRVIAIKNHRVLVCGILPASIRIFKNARVKARRKRHHAHVQVHVARTLDIQRDAGGVHLNALVAVLGQLKAEGVIVAERQIKPVPPPCVRGDGVEFYAVLEHHHTHALEFLVALLVLHRSEYGQQVFLSGCRSGQPKCNQPYRHRKPPQGQNSLYLVSTVDLWERHKLLWG